MIEEERITYFAETDSRNKRVKFGIRAKDRTRHVYVIGKTGMGKSTLLENMAVQDLRNDEGMAFIDPHGKTAELLLEYVPEHRKRDVLYFAPFDMDNPISFNVMEDVGPDKRHLVANGLMSTFKKIWVDAWSARMEYILNNTLLALLEYPDSTLIGVNRMLADKAYRKKVVSHITDPSVKSFWVDEFEKYGERYMQEAGASIQNKIGQFISNPLVRNIIGQPKSSFDMRKMMDEGKIIIINLSKGQVGEQNANLIGSMLITKVYLSAMSRADVHETVLRTLPNFYLYVDEFQSFANESFANILSEARKYKLNLTIAHQYIEQMSEEVRAAVFGNVGTMITFRVGAFDAEVLEKEFAPQFTAEDLVNLGFAQVYMKLMINGISSSPFSAITLPPILNEGINYKDEIIELSRKTFAKPRAEVEKAINEWHEEVEQASNSSKSSNPKTVREAMSGGKNKGSSKGDSRNNNSNNQKSYSDSRNDRSSNDNNSLRSDGNRENKDFGSNNSTNQNNRSENKNNAVTEQNKNQKKNSPNETVADLKSALSDILKEVKKKEAEEGGPSKVPQKPSNEEKKSLNDSSDGSGRQDREDVKGNDVPKDRSNGDVPRTEREQMMGNDNSNQSRNRDTKDASTDSESKKPFSEGDSNNRVKEEPVKSFNKVNNGESKVQANNPESNNNSRKENPNVNNFGYVNQDSGSSKTAFSEADSDGGIREVPEKVLKRVLEVKNER